MVVAFGRRLTRDPDIRDGATGAPEQRPASDAVLLGCHGGAGTSTLAALLGTPWELGGHAPGLERIETFGRPLILVSRDSAPAVARAVEAVTAVVDAGATVACLTVVADGSGPEPREASVRLRLIEDRARRIVRFPFIAALRYADTADLDKIRLPRKAERALAEIRDARPDGEPRGTHRTE
ncbi:hypothetical protein ACFOVU_19470 [Nocardiopsis sediminis]|uniref:Uncharacterized protein n=1 Tax=Nocardiopsis sediminis TaxID=1778267 RepID=A0ABV8FUE8_9ACTN